MVATSGAGWVLAPCLVELINETDRLYPTRDTSSDGSIGDQDHASRTSDHNPSGGYVHAVDVTHDPANGCDVQRLMDHLVATRDGRVAYLIHNGVIVDSDTWRPRAYTGSNPHTHHLHVSIHHTSPARNNLGHWWPTPPGDDDMTPEQEKLLREVHGAVIGPKSGLYSILKVARAIKAVVDRIAAKVGA